MVIFGHKSRIILFSGEPPSEKSVCWWINNKLMPEIYVYRGQNYAFRVQVNYTSEISYKQTLARYWKPC